jgi:hypothetical protein
MEYICGCNGRKLTCFMHKYINLYIGRRREGTISIKNLNYEKKIREDNNFYRRTTFSFFMRRYKAVNTRSYTRDVQAILSSHP